MRGVENRNLRNENNDLKQKLEKQLSLEIELEKAKHRLEELSVIVQNKMTSERELLELSEVLQKNLVRSRTEAMHYKNQLENKSYLLNNQDGNVIFNPPPLKVKHSNSDFLINNNMVIKDTTIASTAKKAIDQTFYEKWVQGDKKEPPEKPFDHRNQHQKARCRHEQLLPY